MHVYVVINKECVTYLEDVLAGPVSSSGFRNLPFGESRKEVTAATDRCEFDDSGLPLLGVDAALDLVHAMIPLRDSELTREPVDVDEMAEWWRSRSEKASKQGVR